ncbi:MAG: SAM-dependent methyltransferase [Chloroflexi bacterium]|nr:SAM-dependent methyltransferase [Chloroflexota bacterium]
MLSDSGRQALREAEALEPRAETFLAVSQQLSGRWPERLARVAVDQALLRQRAEAKFPRASEMLFLREALEQATSAQLAAHHAARLRDFAPRYDLGCGLGGDALALAALGPVVAVDRDPLRLLVLRANAGMLGLGDRVRPVCGDLTSPGWRLPGAAGVFADPARRRQGRRIHDAARYDPPLEVLLRIARSVEGMGVKLSPGIDRRQVEGLGAEVEFVSEGGELKECVLWFGAPRSAGWRATLFPSGATLVGPEAPQGAISPVRAILYEPDPAVLRAGLVRRLGELLGAEQVDPELSLLASDDVRPTALAHAYRVLDVLPFSEKSLRHELRRRGVGRVTLKKRGSAVDTEALARRLRLQGDGEATVLLTRLLGRPLAILMEAARTT